MKTLSEFLAEVVVNKEDFSVCGELREHDYKDAVEHYKQRIAQGIIDYRKYLKSLNTDRFSEAIRDLQLANELERIESTDDSRLKAKVKIDPVCLIHGKKLSDHPSYGCLYCCLCFKSLTPDECYINAAGIKEDVCIECGEREAKQIENKQKKDED